MTLKSSLLALLRCVGIHLLMLLAAAIIDILLAALLLRFSSYALTIACFAVSGAFSGVFCYSATMAAVANKQRENPSLYLLIFILFLGALLFFVIAPLSGWDYNWPVKSFAVTEVAAVIFLWKNKFYKDVEIHPRHK